MGIPKYELNRRPLQVAADQEFDPNSTNAQSGAAVAQAMAALAPAYNSANAYLIYDPATNERYQGAIYGGNNHERRTLYGRVNIGSKVVQQKVIQYKDEIKGMEKGQVLNTTATIYGAGRGAKTWSEYTLVNLQNGAEVYEVYGGGQNGKVFNAESIENYISNYMPSVWPEGTLKAGQSFTQDEWKYAWTLGSSYDIADYWTSGIWKDVKDGERGYTPGAGKEYWKNTNTNLKNPLVRRCEVEDRRFPGVSAEDKALVANKNNANVIIGQGAKVNNYAYGGGYGAAATVSGTTYIALLGGEVKKDIYAGGTSGSVADIFNAGTYSSTNPSGFVANATAYVAGGTVRNVYGGGWRGSVGHHTGEISLSSAMPMSPSTMDISVIAIIPMVQTQRQRPISMKSMRLNWTTPLLATTCWTRVVTSSVVVMLPTVT